MVKANQGRPDPARAILLPRLTAFEGDALESGRDYDAIDFADKDFTDQDASDARFLECRLQRCCLEGLSLRRARLVESLIGDAFGAAVDFTDSTWRDTLVTGGRLGAVTLPGATWTGIRLRGVKLGFVNLAGARLEDVVFEGCDIDSLDARAAHLRSVVFRDSTVQELNVAEATLSKVDLSGANLHSIVGIENLRGAIVSHDQLVDLAPLLAEQLGIEVRPD